MQSETGPNSTLVDRGSAVAAPPANYSAGPMLGSGVTGPQVVVFPGDPAGLTAVIREWAGLQWVWASPCSGGCSQLPDPLPYGFRRATNAEFANRPPITIWGTWSGASIIEPQTTYCASPYFDPKYNHCDTGDMYYGYVTNVDNGSAYETLLVRDLPNTPPTVAADGDVSVDEGSTATNTGTVGDAEGDAVALTASIGSVTNNGDGTWSWSFDTSDGPAQSQTVTITADDGSLTSSTTFELTVNNVAPSVDAGSGATIESGDSFTLTGSFTDPGADSPWTSSIDWGDGNTDSGTTGSHLYLTPGTYTVTLTVTDKDGAAGSASVDVVVTRKAVIIDIKPGSDTNPINLGSSGVTPVAVLSTADFDATTIDPSSVAFGPGGVGTAHGGHIEDVDGDGLADFLAHFDTNALGLTGSDTSACLTGTTSAGVYIQGCDVVAPIAPKGKGHQ